MLLVLGMQISGTDRVEEPRLVSIAVVTRLLIGTVIGVALALLLGIGGVARDVMIVGAAMPTGLHHPHRDAVRRASALLSDVVVVSTVASIVTVTAVLAALSGRVSLL